MSAGTVGRKPRPRPPPPVIDTHIHLFRERDLSSLAWMTDDNPMCARHSLHDWKAAATSSDSPAFSRKPLGFVFVETDRKRSLAPEDFTKPLEEFQYVYDAGTGVDPEYTPVAEYVLGIVAWAPLPLGPDALDRYLASLKKIVQRSGSRKPTLLKGFRYLLQWAAPGEMLDPTLVEGLKWMGRQNFVFEMTLDCRGQGLWQLKEAVELLKRCGSDRGTIILDHLAKPNLHVAPQDIATSESFLQWRSGLQEFAACGKTYIKLSGAFSELDPELMAKGKNVSGAEREKWIQEVISHVKPWISAAVEAFGAHRTLWGSDWPVCTVTAGKESAWGLWLEVIEQCLDGVLEPREKERIWWETAAQVYGIDAGVEEARSHI